MAGGVMLVERTDGKTYTGKLTGYVVFVSIVAGSGGLLFGEPFCPRTPYPLLFFFDSSLLAV
jgi:hypothetical protein